MNRRRFAFSWGRKLFFGISFPLSLALSLIYLKSFILPQSFGDIVYFITTWVGHFGLLNALVYFILFAPIVFVFPTYYVSRFWSLILILILNLLILVDALSFANYGLHLYSYLSELLLQEGIHHLLGSNVLLTVIGALLFVFAILIWIRGEMIWRYMQGRFSNPVSNWYIVLILICLVVSKSIYHFGGIHPSLAEVFPLNKNFDRQEINQPANKKFYYPSSEISCGGKSNPNIVLVTISEWNNIQVTAESMPFFNHIKNHAHSFTNHQNVADDVTSGYFSLFYSVPAYYQSSLKSEVPAFVAEVTKRSYDVAEFGSKDSTDETTYNNLENWFINRSGDEIRPFYLSLRFNGHPQEADKFLQNIVGKLQQEDMLKNTNIIFTGAYSGTESNLLPLYWVTNEKKFKEFNNPTTPYDVMPTLMESFWNCKKVFKTASVGEPLEKDEQDWFLISLHDGFGIADLKTKGTTVIRNGKILDSGSGARKELIFQALKKLNSFNKPQ